MESWQDEIIKAQISQEIGVERSMENSDTSIFLKSFEENLISCVDRDSFDKSWSSDLAKKFPDGAWRTINGANVFINNGKVIAGLDGFNKEIDTFFEQKGKKAEGKKKGDIRIFRNFTDYQNVKYNISGQEVDAPVAVDLKIYGDSVYINRKKTSISDEDIDTIDTARCELFITKAINNSPKNGNKVFYANGEFTIEPRFSMYSLVTKKEKELREILSSLNIEIEEKPKNHREGRK